MHSMTVGIKSRGILHLPAGRQESHVNLVVILSEAKNPMHSNDSRLLVGMGSFGLKPSG
jgi:hypothetical protein